MYAQFTFFAQGMIHNQWRQVNYSAILLSGFLFDRYRWISKNRLIIANRYRLEFLK